MMLAGTVESQCFVGSLSFGGHSTAILPSALVNQ
jgi:hypothetical protein